jgi:hypothetical protein
MIMAQQVYVKLASYQRQYFNTEPDKSFDDIAPMLRDLFSIQSDKESVRVEAWTAAIKRDFDIEVTYGDAGNDSPWAPTFLEAARVANVVYPW